MVLILVKKEPVTVFNRFDSRSSYSYIHVFVKTLVAMHYNIKYCWSFSFKEIMASLIFFKGSVQISIILVSSSFQRTRTYKNQRVSKVYLDLCSQRWLKASRNRVNGFIPNQVINIVSGISCESYESQKQYLKGGICFTAFLNSESHLFHSCNAYGKKESLKGTGRQNGS